MRWLAALVVVAACQGTSRTEDAAKKAEGGSSTSTSTSTSTTGDAELGSGSADEPHVKPEDPDPVEPGKSVADLGAVSAWQAVIDRARYLGRRGQHGVAYGTLGGAIAMPDPKVSPDAGVPPMIASPYAWLIDDTEGNGSLAIRVLLGAKGGAAKEGDRVALGGAWELDGERRWFWKVDGLDRLPEPARSELKDPPAAVPGHVIVNGELPNGARTISLAKDNDAVYFQVVGAPPITDGDGWPVADELGNPTAALLNLPGERAAYGSQDMRTADERWTLRRGVTYWVRIGKVRKKPGKPASMNARTAPVRVK